MRQSEAGRIHYAADGRWHVRPCQRVVRLCYRCNRPGHLVRDCPWALIPNEAASRSLPAVSIGGTGQGGREQYAGLSEPGPVNYATCSRWLDAPYQDEVRLCYGCRQPGHLIRECPGALLPDKAARNSHDQMIVGSCQSNVRLCYGCMQPGHLIRECPKSMFSGRTAPLSAGIGRGGRGNDGLRQRGQERGGRGRTVVLTPQNAETCNEMISGCDNIRPWSDLPPLVLCKIAMRLTSLFAFSAYAGVCSSWSCRRSVVKSVKSDFIASQPPLLLTLPHPSSRKLTYSFYSLIEDRSYSAESLIPAKSWQPTSAPFIKFSYLGYSHGYLIMLSTSAPIDHRPGEIFTFTWDAPSLLSPRTGERINLKHTTDCAVMFSGGLLTAPVIFADCKLMLFDHRNMHCWQIRDSSLYMFELPAFTYSAVVHKGRLYLASDNSRVWLLNANHPHEVIQVIQPPTEYHVCQNYIKVVRI